jgi:hypothetical protein
MNAIYLLFLVTLMKIELSHGFAPRIKVSHPSSSSKSAISVRHKTSLNSIEAFSALVAMGDYAAEIEKGVGEEIYAPIFKSGLVLFGSGLISAFMAVIIIVKSNSWEELGLEFERGKEGQLIKLEERPVDVTGIVYIYIHVYKRMCKYICMVIYFCTCIFMYT